MKKLVILLLGALMCLPINSWAQGSAQETPVSISSIDLNDLDGRYFIGGSANFSLNTSGIMKDSDPSYTGMAFGIRPHFGRFATNRLAYGGVLGLSHNSSTNNPDTDLETSQSSNIFNVGVFGRVYSNPCGEAVNGYLQGEVTFGFGNQKSIDASDNETKDGIGTFEFGVRPAVVFYPTNHIMIEMRYGWLGYYSYSTTYKNFMGEEVTSTNRTFNANFNFSSIQIGFMYLLPCESWNTKMNGSFDGFGEF